MKVFWTEVALERVENGFAPRLDGRPLKTPGKAVLSAPTEALGAAIAEEWRAQSGDVDPASMPLTRAANSAIDRVTPMAADVAAEIAGYGGTDLLCYRAPHPAALAARQAAAWDPLLAWAAQQLGAPLDLTEGVMHLAQPQASLEVLTRAVEAHDPWQLTALHGLVTLSGSLVLGLAVSHRHMPAAEAWPLSRIDEQWNIEEWGADEEAERLAAEKKTAFTDAARLMDLLRG
ncbi:MAG: ATP12 family protein [Pseudomonadota bacterium]